MAGSAPGSATSPIRYAHEEAAGLGAGVAAAGQLTSVTWQDGHRRTYHYENAQFPGWLTGRTDEAGVRIGTYVYDAYGRVQREFGPGGTNELRFRYINNTAELTDLSTGTARSTLYTYETAPGVIRPVTVSAPCPLCGSSQARTAYTAAGDVARSVGHDGRITFYSYDAKGRETERAVYSSAYASATTRPALNLAEQVVSTRWHATWNLPTMVAEPGKTSSYSYNSLGQITSQSWSATTDATGAAKFSASKTGSTYTTAWTYDANRLNTVIVERTDSVETQRWTLAYNGMGDLARITDVTGGNLVGRGTSYDPNGRLLEGITDAGVVLRRQYSPRGFVASSSVDNEISTYMQNGVGLTTQVHMPDGQVLQYLYDANYQLTNVQLNGASITAAMLALADYPDTPLKALAARGRASLALAVEALISPAYAQSGQLLRRVVPIPGRPMPGQPEYDPRSDLIRMAPMSTFDRVALGIAERTARECECKPDGGYDRPTFTMVSFAHVLFSGHLSPRFSDKSYFATSEKVGQTLVDEIMTRPDERRQSERDLVSSRVVREVTLIRPLGAVGYARTANGTFVPTNRVRLVYEREQCDKRIRARNEVVTIFPI